MIKLIIDNVYTKIENVTPEVEQKIWDELAFEVEEYGQQNTHKRHLYNRKTKKTYSGLLNYVIDIINNAEEDYEIVDTRVKHEPNANFALVEEMDIGGGKTVKLEFRPYQKEIVDNATEREVIQAATGAGKTFMMAAMIAKFNVKPVAVFADKLSLCTQIKEEFEKFLGVPVGLIGGGMSSKHDITVYSIQSASADDVKDAKMIMFDECLDGDTLVTLSDGSQMTIQEIVEAEMPLEVISYNSETKQFEFKEIYGWQKIPLKNKGKKMVKVTIEDEIGKEYIIKCTDDHKIWVENENKYIQAKDLISGMEVICNG